jgi:hypothetical protein
MTTFGCNFFCGQASHGIHELLTPGKRPAIQLRAWLNVVTDKDVLVRPD